LSVNLACASPRLRAPHAIIFHKTKIRHWVSPKMES
jgi:hypothetical protein